ncbi:MAG: alpha/beta hydrolase, partial [Psychrobium sp.]|nr:alpha/beta hydrolase [Psychrobium sp.]
ALGPLAASPDKTRENLFKSITNQYRNLDKNKALHLDMQSAINARKLASDFDHDIAEILVHRGLKKISDGYTWRSDMRLRNLSRLRMTQAQATDILSGIKAPTLLVLGDSGMPALREHLIERKKLLQDLTVISIAGGHHVHMQQPQLVAQHIIKHIKR